MTGGVVSLQARVLLPISIGFWFAGMATSRLELTGFGLASGLSPLWFAGLVAAIIGFLLSIMTRRHTSLLMVYVLVIVTVVATPAVILEQSPRFPYIYQSHVYAHELMATGAIDFSAIYFSWPGWHIVTATVIGATRFESSAVLMWIPLWLLALFTLGVYSAGRRLRLPRMQLWFAVGLGAVFSIAPYPVPAGMAIVLLLYLLAVIASQFTESRRARTPRILMLILMAAVVVTHLLTSLVMAASVAVMSLVARFRRRPNTARPVWAIPLVFVVVYLFYIITQTTAHLLPAQVESILNFERLFAGTVSTTASGIVAGSPEHLRVVIVRISFVLVLSGLAAAGGLYALLGRRRPRIWLIPTAWILGSFASFAVGPYGGEIVARAYGLALPALLIVSGILSRAKAGRMVLAVVILLAALATPINHFGNELFDHVRPSELAVDEALETLGPEEFSFEASSRTWHQSLGNPSVSPYVTVTGPLYDRTRAFIGGRAPTEVPYWSYDNGDLTISISADEVE